MAHISSFLTPLAEPHIFTPKCDLFSISPKFD